MATLAQVMSELEDQNHRSALDERGSAVFVPDILVPSQYFDRVRERRDHDPERRLLFAVLENAVDDYRKALASRRGDRDLRELEEWFESRDTSWFCSFQNICDVLGLDAEYMRRGLRAWNPQTRVAVSHPDQEAHDLAEPSSDRGAA